MTGTLVGIYTAAGEAAPMEAHDEIAAIAGAGLAGDRYAAGAGAFSDRPGGGREVTLIAREGIAAANDEGVTVGEHETRRNLVTEGVDLDQLVGRTFSVGEVVLRGVRDCPPCKYLEGLTRPGVLAALKGRGGLRADIVRAGVLRVGDEIVEVDAV
jgi:MOSC domain-containing protein YiiM